MDYSYPAPQTDATQSPVNEGVVELDLAFLRRPSLVWKQSGLILAIALAHLGAATLLNTKVLPALRSQSRSRVAKFCRALSQQRLSTLVTTMAISAVGSFQFTNPGFVKVPPRTGSRTRSWMLPLDTHIKDLKLKRNWCSECEVYRPLRCSHCLDCNRCVLMNDHHCRYLGNCVGKQNYRSYLVVLLALMLPAFHAVPVCAMAIGTSWCGSLLASLRSQKAAYLLVLAHIGGAFGPMNLLYWHTSFVKQNITTREWYKRQLTAGQEEETNPFDEGSTFANVLAFLGAYREDGTM